MNLELLSRSEERAGRFWPWSKKRVQWLLSVSGDPCLVEITHSWATGISRVFVNRQFLSAGVGGEFRFEFSPAPEVSAVALVSRSKPGLEVDGWPVEWLSPRIRREQAEGISVYSGRGGYAAMAEPSTGSSNLRLPFINS